MIDIRPFFSRDRNRGYLSESLTRGDCTYATNGHAAVRVVAREPETTEHESTLDALVNVFSEIDGMTFRPFEKVEADVIKREFCPRCRGARFVTICDVCEGEGEHRCCDDKCGQDHECGACDGRGASPARKGDDGAIACEDCEDGRKPDERRVHLGGDLCVSWPILQKVQALPGPIEWAFQGPTIEPDWPNRKTYQKVAFRGPGWAAIILPRGHYGEAIEAPRMEEPAHG